MIALKLLSLAFPAFTMIGARGAANQSTTYANKDLQTASLPDIELEKDRQPVDTIIALEMEGDVMKLPAIALPPQLDAGKLQKSAVTGAETGSKK